MRSRLVQTLVGTAALAALYFAAARLGHALGVIGPVTPVWPPAGIALAAVLRFGRRALPGIAAGALLASVSAGDPLATACGIAAGNTLEALTGAWLLRRCVGFDGSLSRLRDVLGLVVLAAPLSAAVSATAGVISLFLGGVLQWDACGAVWGVWWLGNAVGDLVVAPLLLTALTGSGVPRTLRGWAEAAALAAAVVVVCLLAFGPLAPGGRRYSVEYAVFPLLIWASLRFGPGMAAMATALASAVAAWGTAHTHGPGRGALVLLQAFLAVAAVTGLVLSAALAEWRRAREALAGSEQRYRLLFEALPEPMWVYDLDTLRFLDVNAAAVAGYGHAREQFLGMTLEDLHHPEDMPSLLAAARGLLPGRASACGESAGGT
jgi:integral membrane sensor domain MASE1